MRLAETHDYRFWDVTAGHMEPRDADWFEVAAHGAGLVADGMELYQLRTGLVYVRGGTLAQRLAVCRFAETWQVTR